MNEQRSGEQEAPHCTTCACAAVGYVQQARWSEWEAVCTVSRCGWRQSRGNRTREDAERHMRGHAAICHPPRIPVRRTSPAATEGGARQ